MKNLIILTTFSFSLFLTGCAKEGDGKLSRIDRMGMPGVNTAVISKGNKDAYNKLNPDTDGTAGVPADITANVTALHNALDDDLTGAGLTPCAASTCVSNTAPLVIPDELSIDTGNASGFPNGRELEDQVMDITLSLLLLDQGTHSTTTLADLPLNPSANDKTFSSTFPFLAEPH